MGDNLSNLVKQAQQWFIDNNVRIPETFIERYSFCSLFFI